MRKKRVAQTAYSVVLVFLLSFSLVSSFSYAAKPHDPEQSSMRVVASSDDAVQPIIRHPNTMDEDFDGIQDSMENMVSQMVANKGAVLPVVVTLCNPVTSQDLDWFVMLGGRVTHVYRYVTYGFAGVIPAANISKFATLEKGRLSVIEYDASMRYHLDVSVPLIRARPTVWETYGYTGSSSESIAIIDTGIDDSHPDVGPYGDLNFSRKIVGWYDATADGTSTPQDYGEHGTHVAGIAVGTGVANRLQGSSSIKTTFTHVLPPERPGPGVYGYVDYIDVISPGVIKLNCSWGGTNNVLLVLSSPAGEVGRTSGTSQPLILTYNTIGKAHPTGRYEVFVGNVAGPSGTPFSCLETYPYQGLNDGHNLFTGVAPNSKLVGVKVFDNTGSGTMSTVMAGMEWVIENRMTYNITVASMSVGLEDGATDTTLDEKADTMVTNGIVTVVSAGNDFPEYTIGSPGTAAHVLTVAATNDQNGITSYSSNGETSKNEFGLIKPDVAAPGGTFQLAYGNQIVSADSNDVDSAYSGFADQNLDDYQQMAGTSMATPHVAGLAALIIEALGSWNWTFEEALKVKMIISMTSFEAQGGEGTNVPTLDRGGKDSKEGYGRVNADAAIEAVTMNYSIEELAVDTFGASPWDKKVWARQAWFSANTTYEFRLSVPSDADYDLYFYDGTPDGYGQPVILEKSTNTYMGGQEALSYTPTSSGAYYIVIKWVNGSGTFNLTSMAVKHDVAVVNVTPHVSEAYNGEIVNITVIVKNEGTVKETFDVTAYYDESVLGTTNVSSLAPEANITLTFVWNTSNISPGYYVISVVAEPVPDEKDLGDNLLVYGTMHVKIPGDINGDGIVDILDVAEISTHYYDPPWLVGPLGYDPNADIDNDGKVDIVDATIINTNWHSEET